MKPTRRMSMKLVLSKPIFIFLTTISVIMLSVEKHFWMKFPERCILPISITIITNFATYFSKRDKASLMWRSDSPIQHAFVKIALPFGLLQNYGAFPSQANFLVLPTLKFAPEKEESNFYTKLMITLIFDKNYFDSAWILDNNKQT